MIRIERIQNARPAYVKALNALLPQLKSSSPPAELDMAALDSIVANPNIVLLTAEDDGKIVGCIVLVIYRNLAKMRAWIENVIVDESYRNRGIGELLSTHAIIHAVGKGVNDINLTSRPDREAANRLYKRLRFVKRDTNTYRYEVRGN